MEEEEEDMDRVGAAAVSNSSDVSKAQVTHPIRAGVLI
jgi:hypothetical protein